MRNKQKLLGNIFEVIQGICSIYKSDLRLFIVMITCELNTLLLEMSWTCDFGGVRLL